MCKCPFSIGRRTIEPMQLNFGTEDHKHPWEVIAHVSVRALKMVPGVQTAKAMCF